MAVRVHGGRVIVRMHNRRLCGHAAAAIVPVGLDRVAVDEPPMVTVVVVVRVIARFLVVAMAVAVAVVVHSRGRPVVVWPSTTHRASAPIPQPAR